MTHRPEHDFWMTHPADPDYLPPADRWCRVCTRPDSDSIHGDTTYADEHECGQLRLGVPGEQVSLLPLPDKEIPQRCHICHHGADEGHALSCPTRWY